VQQQPFSKGNGRGPASARRLPLPRPPTSAFRGSDAWYVTSWKGLFTEMRIAKSRSEAIALACDMLRRGIGVTGVGPMLEMGWQRIDAAAIRQIFRERTQDRGIPEVASVCWIVR
jgi:hypothetical protein